MILKLKKINQDLKKINDSKIFNKKIVLDEQEGNGIYSYSNTDSC